jgi:hypothetical protein
MLEIRLMIATYVIIIIKHGFLWFLQVFNISKLKIKQNVRFINKKWVIKSTFRKYKLEKKIIYSIIDKEKDCTTVCFFLHALGYI